jgi:hypothetical protein
MTPIESRWKELSNGILVDVGIQKLTPNHQFPLQNPGIAASNSFGHPHQGIHIVLSLAAQVL